MIVTLDAKYLSVRDPNSRSSPGQMNAIDKKEEQHTGHHKQIRQSRSTFVFFAFEASRVVAPAGLKASYR